MLTFNVLIEIPDEEGIDIFDRPIPDYNTVFNAVDSALGNLPKHLGWISSSFMEIGTPGMNSGRCVICGAWVTDREKPKPISGLCNGATVDGNLLCDEHLPAEHRWAF